MTACISSLLDSGTGPSQLRSALRLKTRPLRAVLAAATKIRALQSRMPASLFGGDVLGIMSARLRELLQESDTSHPISSATRIGHTSFEPLRNKTRRRKTLHAPAAAATKPSEAHLEELIHESDAAERFEDLHATSDMSGTFFQPVAHEARQDQRDWKSKSAHDSDEKRWSQPGSRTSRKESREGSQSLLAQKLDRYWQLAQPSSTPGGSSSTRLRDAASPNVVPALATFSSGKSGAVAGLAWPDLLGKSAARSALTADSASSSRRVEQVAGAGFPEKVEIQNVFNIEVTSGGVVPESTEDLSEKIADILREQAIQHGIDIT